MAEFALGSIATMASNNPSVQLNGQRPILGSTLEVVWKSAVALLVTILGAHTALSALAFYMDCYNRHTMLTPQ